MDPIQYDWYPYKKRKFGCTQRDTKYVHDQKKGSVRTQLKDSHLQPSREAFAKTTLANNLDLGPPASRNVRK